MVKDAKTRDLLFDNLKGIGIILVVFAHLLQANLGGLNEYIYIDVYSFHMPLFVLISGYFSKKISGGYYRKTAENCLIPLVIVNAVYYIPKIAVHSATFVDALTPMFASWYFLALFYWKAALPIFKKINKKVLLPISLVLGIAAGFINQIGGCFSLSRAIAFFVFFLIGYYADKSIVEKIRKLNKYLCFAVLIACFACAAYLYSAVFSYKSLRNVESYSQIDMTMLSGAAARLIGYVFSLVICVCLINLVSRKHSIITIMGQVGRCVVCGKSFSVLRGKSIIAFRTL